MNGITGHKSCYFGQSQRLVGILLGTEKAPRVDEDIDRTKTNGNYELTEEDRKEKTQAGKWQCLHKFTIVI